MKPLDFVGSSITDLSAFPIEARRAAGFELWQVQRGLAPSDFKPMPAIGAGAYEIRIRVGAAAISADRGAEMSKERITRSSENVFVDLGFSPEEAAVLAMRADLMARLRIVIEENGWTQTRAAKVLGVTQARVSDLVRGKWERFSLDMLLMLATRAGLRPRLTVATAA